jgi:hypothetical protein
MELDNEYSIGSDNVSCTLYRNEKPVGYYHTIQGCLKRYFNERLKECESLYEVPLKVKEVLKVIEEAEEKIG